MTVQPELFAVQESVKRGVVWLNQHAPIGWQWNLFVMARGGKVYFRARDAYDNECALALAFTHRADLVNSGGYVTFASVANKLNLDQEFLRTHGFACSPDVPSKMLDIAWEGALLTYARPSSIVFRHPTETDRLFADLPPYHLSRFQNLLGWFNRIRLVRKARV